ncbi:ECF transporter S component [Candidatus Bathyarchaeota archaeon]|nr:ECF transporter S component [Candidatus Bathyarchaeota archaeon]
MSTTMRLAMTAIFTSLVAAVTMVFSLYVPQTRGFFNIGETMVYTTALLFGPFVGSFAGGVGSSLADLLLGFWYYAPATLVIKGLEGGLVGFLGGLRPKLNPKLWKGFTFTIGLIVGVLLGGIGSLYYSGIVELRLGIPPPENPNLIFTVPPEFWYVLGALVVILIALTGFVWESDFGWLVFTLLIGGTIMVTGYFLYQKFLLFPLFGIETIAEAEIPFNVAQMLIGLVVAIPIAKIAMRSFPQLKS